MKRILALLLTATLAARASAQAPAGSGKELEATLRPLLLEAIPKQLYAKEQDWGRQSPTINGLKWRGLKPTVQKTPRNDGHWRKINLETRNLPGTLSLVVSDLKNADADRQTFRIFLAFQVGVLYDHQHWESGIRLWSGSVRARMRVKLQAECETTLRIEPSKELLPDIVFRFRVTCSNFSYDDLVVEHLAGVGGTAAKLVGDALHDGLTQWRPSIERDLLAKANASILKAADTKEVRLSLGKWTKLK
jgi:hypothetical protein